MRQWLTAIAVTVCMAAIVAVTWWVLSAEATSLTRLIGPDEAPASGPDPVGVARKGAASAQPDAQPAAPVAPARSGQELAGKVSRGIPDGEEQPYSHVLLRLAPASDRAFDEPVASAESDRRGRFRMADVPPGQYHLLAFAPDFPPRIVGDILVEAEGAPASLHLFYDEVAAGSRGGAPLAEAEGTAETLPEDTMASEGMVLENPELAAGTLTMRGMRIMTENGPVELSGPGGIPDGVEVSYEFIGGEGQHAIKIQSAVTRDQPPVVDEPSPDRAIIAGTARDSRTGAPLAGASIRLRGRENDRSDRANQDGRFEFKRVEPGDYAVTFDGLKTGSLFEQSSANVIVNAAAGQTVDVQLLAIQALVVRGVVASGQAKAAGVLVGDEVLTYNNVPVQNSEHLRQLRSEAPEHQPVDLVVSRDGAILSFAIHGGTIGINTDLVYK